MPLYLDVPYSEKEEAKKLGAKCNPKIKIWFADTPREKYVNFSKWILKDTDEALIATEYLYIIEGKRECWKCGKSTPIIGLGIGEFIHIFGESDKIDFEIIEDRIDIGEEVHLAWTNDENKIPAKLLNYLKEHYPVKTGYSNTVEGNYFANHCMHCGAIQGNWFIFDEPDSPLSSCIDGDELIERMRRLTIKLIPIEDDLQLDWDIAFCSNDFAYLKYGKVVELILSTDSKNEYISYEELYSR